MSEKDDKFLALRAEIGELLPIAFRNGDERLRTGAKLIPLSRHVDDTADAFTFRKRHLCCVHRHRLSAFRGLNSG